MIDSDNRRRCCSCLPMLPCHAASNSKAAAATAALSPALSTTTIGCLPPLPSIRYRDYRGLERTPPRPGNDSILPTLPGPIFRLAKPFQTFPIYVSALIANRQFLIPIFSRLTPRTNVVDAKRRILPNILNTRLIFFSTVNFRRLILFPSGQLALQAKLVKNTIINLRANEMAREDGEREREREKENIVE